MIFKYPIRLRRGASFTNLTETCGYGYLLFILSFELGSKVVISTFKKGKSISPGLPFLHFCKK
jgi:hypothetical protein